MKIYNVGIIGFGGFGKFLFNAWKQLDSVLVTSISDLNLSATDDLDNVRFFTDWRQMLLVQEIDLIAIVTEPSTHHMIALECMKAGKHILIEKPLAISVSEAEEIIDTRDQMGVVAAIDFIMRFNPLLKSLQSFTQNGVFGKLRRVDIENYAQDEQLPAEHWFWNTERSGGILIEHAVHFIDLIHFLAPSEYVTVNGLKHSRNQTQEDQVIANVLYQSGMIATHYHSFARPGFFETTEIILSYDLADIHLHGWIPLTGDIRLLVNQQTKKMITSDPMFEAFQTEAIKSVMDQSRPDGWGKSTFNISNDTHVVRSGGIMYNVDEMITGRFTIGHSKQEVYAECVRLSLLDLLRKISDPTHILTASLEAGLSSLEIAELATISARNNN